MNARRELAVALAVAAAGSALALFAATRDWAVVETLRSAPLPPHVEVRTGRDVAPWGVAIGFVGLAGAVALLATRGIGRLLVAAVLALCGVGLVAAGVAGLGLDPASSREQVDVHIGWPLLTLVAGVFVMAAGGLALARFRAWQRDAAAMGARYDAPAASTRDKAPAGAGDPATMWDALDRGEDPTTR